ncbi:MAG TPA: sulfur carrier protein ThiS [Candidatus Xenobia bacterium]|nr:sulfur carrier protein ThiS [Candidatus Xenobia bacterium]
MIETTINGAPQQVPENLTLRELLRYLNLGEDRVAIERNRRIVKREEWESVRVEPGDQLEIVHFVGGG